MKEVKKYLLIFCISLAILLIFSTSTSPLYENYYEDDSSIFILIGKAITKGMIPYKDIFDHKGPILFWIQALGQKIHEGRIGIFIIQVINLSITNILFYKIAKNFCTSKKSIMSILFAMSIFTLFIEEGNLSEEFSLLFIAVCIYLAIKWVKSANLFDKKIFKYSFFYGICFSIVSLIRLNNAASIVGLLLGIIIIFIKNKKIKELLKCSIFFILGIMLIYLPVLIYFYSKSALYDMVYGTFIHNFKYLNSESNILLKFCYSLHVPIMALLTIKTNRKNSNMNIIISSAMIVTYIILFFGPGYSHYYVLTIPFIIIYFSQILNNIEIMKIERIFLYLIIIFVSFTYMFRSLLNISFYLNNIEKVTMKNIENIVIQIPEEERNSVFVYNHSIGSSIYLYTNLMPCYKYAFLQNKLFETNNEIENEMYAYMQENNIQWIIGKNITYNSSRGRIEKYILDNYKIVDNIIVQRLDFLELVDEEIFLYKKLDKDNNK